MPKSAKPMFILASQSPRRIELLKAAAFVFEVRPAQIDETPFPGEEPIAYVRRMAQTKARSVFEPDLALPTLSADTAVTLDGAVFGKPGDRGEAKKMLTALSGKTHKVITGYCVHMGDNKPEICGSVETGITFRALTAQEIDGYLDRGESMDKAGAYAIQLGAGFMTADVDGSFTNIVGLPLKEVIDSLFSALGGDPRRQGGRMNPF